MTATRTPQLVAALTLSAVALVACTATPAEQQSAASEAGAGVDFSATEAGDLRLELEGLFGLHAHLLLEPTRVRPALVDATVAAANDNTKALSAVVRSAYDDEAARTFSRLWNRYSAAARTYAERGDKRKKTARTALLRAGDRVAFFMADATQDGMQRDGTAALVRSATRALIAHGDAVNDNDREAMYASEREAFAALVAVGRAFAAGTSEYVPKRYPGPRNSGPLELRSALRQLLGEHTVLTGTVVRRGSEGTKDFSAVAAALNGNTEDLVTAIDSVYGTIADEFAARWRRRISLLADYTVAAVEKPDDRRGPRRKLRRADARIASLVGDASEDNIDAEAVAEALRGHTEGLIAQIDAYLDKDFDGAQDELLATYGIRAELADLLANGIVAQRPDEFPTP